MTIFAFVCVVNEISVLVSILRHLLYVLPLYVTVPLSLAIFPVILKNVLSVLPFSKSTAITFPAAPIVGCCAVVDWTVVDCCAVVGTVVDCCSVVGRTAVVVCEVAACVTSEAVVFCVGCAVVLSSELDVSCESVVLSSDLVVSSVCPVLSTFPPTLISVVFL